MRRSKGTLMIAVLFLSLLITLLVAQSSQAHGEYSSTAEFLNTEILEPRGSVLDGHQLVNNWRWYGIPVRSQLAILGAETSLGTSRGGRLVGANNFGCIRSSSGYQSTAWGEWASGTIRVGGKTWLRWPTPAKGAHAWGRYMKVGVGGAYQSMVFGANPNWSRFAATYYGSGVPGIGHYVANLRAIDREFTRLAREHGFRW